MLMLGCKTLHKKNLTHSKRVFCPLTLFEMNCWFPCDQDHVKDRQLEEQISLLE